MATRIHFSPRYGTHLVPLLRAVMMTTGSSGQPFLNGASSLLM